MDSAADSASEPQKPAGPHERSVGIDLVRILGIFAIVLGHVSISPWIAKATYSWHVPVFFFLTGVLWKPGRTLAQETQRRFVSIVRPYLAWLLVISVIALPRAALSGGFLHFLQRLATILLGGQDLGTPYTAFWFFSCLFFASLLWRLGESLRVPWWSMVAVALPLTLAGPYLATVPLSAGTAVPATIFIAAGRGYQLAPASLKRWPVGLVALMVGGAVVIAGLTPPLDLKSGHFGTPLVGVLVACLISAGLVSCAIPIGARVNRLGRRAVSAISTRGAAVILAHGLPLTVMYGRASTAAVLVAVLAATAILVGIAGITPWRSALLGLPPNPRRNEEPHRSLKPPE